MSKSEQQCKQQTLAKRRGFVVYELIMNTLRRLKHKIMKLSPFLTCLDFGVCAPQSASFALATTHSPNVLLNASRPYRRSPSAYFEGIHGVRFAWGNTDAIDFVAIASSLQATNGIQGVCNTNRLKAVPLVHRRKNPHSPVHLYFPSSSAFASSPPCGSRSVYE